MTKEAQPGDGLEAMLAALPINPRNLDQLRAIQSEVAALKKDRDSWERELQMYAKAWLREMGGRLFNKRHRIDAYVKTTEHIYEGYQRARKAGLISETFFRDVPPSATAKQDTPS